LTAALDTDKLARGPGTMTGPFSFLKVRAMTREPTRVNPSAMERDRPVQPGSPLYRILEMIAREIVKDLEKRRGTPAQSNADE
jgi:hypothetical protein